MEFFIALKKYSTTGDYGQIPEFDAAINAVVALLDKIKPKLEEEVGAFEISGEGLEKFTNYFNNKDLRPILFPTTTNIINEISRLSEIVEKTREIVEETLERKNKIEHTEISDKIDQFFNESKKSIDQMESLYNEQLGDYIENLVEFAQKCQKAGIDGFQVTKEFVKLYDNTPLVELDHKVEKVYHKYICKILNVDPKSDDGNKVMEMIKSKNSDCQTSEEIESKFSDFEERKKKKEKIRKGLDPNSITFHLKAYKDTHPNETVYWNFD